MSGLRWTRQSEALLISAWNAGVEASALADRFGSNDHAILQKIHTLRAAGVELRQGESAIGALKNRRQGMLARLRLYR